LNAKALKNLRKRLVLVCVSYSYSY